MLPTEVFCDGLRWLSREDLDLLTVACKMLRATVTTAHRDGPLRLIHELEIQAADSFQLYRSSLPELISFGRRKSA